MAFLPLNLPIRQCPWLVWLDGENTVPSCRAGIECGGGDSPCFVDSAFGACLLFGYLSVRGVSRYHFLGFGKGKEESFPLLGLLCRGYAMGYWQCLSSLW